MHYSRKELMEVLNISIQLSKGNDRQLLLNTILNKSMEFTNCDAGTLYLYENNALTFKIMKTNSQNISKGETGEVIDLPPVPLKEENICAYAAIHQQVLNIEDVWSSTMFDFSGPKRYDKLTGYCTKSMLVVPISNYEGKLIGVLQLINAQDAFGNITHFEKEVEPIILALASQGGIILANQLYLEEIKMQMWSFTEALAETVDARTPYNGSHIRKVAKYAEQMADYINLLYEQGKETEYFDQQRKEQLVMGALLHDIGKLVIPLEILNKAKRLGDNEQLVWNRLELIEAYYEIDYLKEFLSFPEFEEKQKQLKEVKEVVKLVNESSFVPEELKQRLHKVLPFVYSGNGRVIPYFTEEEKECLLIERGTLTKAEREIVESHVVMTERILSKVHFNSYYADCPTWAVTHHELLDGKGYPRKLKGDELALESRIMAVVDICDALLASDRPYKKPIPKEKAFAIMEGMVKEGKLDGKLVGYMKECLKEDE